MRKVYHHFASPDGIFRAEVAGLPIVLSAKTGKELLSLEGLLVTERGWSERATLEAFLSFLRPGDVAYDVGANFGLYAVALAKKVREQGLVVAFEPVRSTFERLQANVELNHLQNVRCYQKALGERNAQIRMHTFPEEPWCSTLVERQDGDSGRPEVMEFVDVVGGDSFRHQEGLPIPRAVKIDVEGFEHAVIYGLRQTLGDPACQFLCCEIHTALLPAGITPQQIMDVLRNLGFGRMEVSSRGCEQQVSCYKE
jgi:FkbM family methyltransferase